MIRKKSVAGMLIFLGWLVYTISYLGKLNYSANITQIIDHYGVTKSEAGLVPTVFFFAYGIGQVVNGILCKKYNIKWVIFGALMVSATINLAIAMGCRFELIKWLWMANGFSLSVLWPTLIRLMSEKLPKQDLNRSSIIMGTTVAMGTLIIYGCSSVFAIFDGFRYAFYLAGFADIFVAVFWMLSYKKATDIKEKEDVKNTQSSYDFGEKNAQTKTEKKVFFAAISILCVCAIGVNLIKDGLTTWLPSILKEEYSLPDSLSILLTLLLPIVAIFGNAFALNMHKKVKDYITHCFLIFALMGVMILAIIGSLSIKNVLIMLGGLILVNLFASSLNSLITSIFPMFMREKVNSGMFAGVLNGFCYVGSTLSSYGLGYIAEHYGWNSVFWTLVAFCVIIVVIWTGYKIFKTHMTKGEDDFKLFQ